MWNSKTLSQHARGAMLAATLPAEAFEPPKPHRFTPQNCPHCEYDRKFPETAGGGWIYPGNGSPIVPCGMCNPDGKHPRS